MISLVGGGLSNVVQHYISDLFIQIKLKVWSKIMLMLNIMNK